MLELICGLNVVISSIESWLPNLQSTFHLPHQKCSKKYFVSGFPLKENVCHIAGKSYLEITFKNLSFISLLWPVSYHHKLWRMHMLQESHYCQWRSTRTWTCCQRSGLKSSYFGWMHRHDWARVHYLEISLESMEIQLSFFRDWGTISWTDCCCISSHFILYIFPVMSPQ